MRILRDAEANWHTVADDEHVCHAGVRTEKRRGVENRREGNFRNVRAERGEMVASSGMRATSSRFPLDTTLVEVSP